MYSEDNQLHIVKGLMTLQDFNEAYKPHETKNCVIHFRIKTHGNKDQENTHPFAVDERLGMVHNGIITAVETKEDNTKSDTWHFTKKHLFTFRKNNYNFYTNPIYKEMIESYIGFSKLIFMDNKGKVSIFNEAKGKWDSGCWFSNSSYVPYTPPKHKNSWKNPNPQQNVHYLPPPKVCPVPDYTPELKKSDSNPKVGDFYKTETIVIGKDKLNNDVPIPIGSYVRLTYFAKGAWVGIEEILTGITSELHLTYLKPLPHLSLGDLHDFESVPL